MKRVRLVSLITLLIIAATSLTTGAITESQTYLPFIAAGTTTSLALANPGFEGNFRYVDSIPELLVADGWTPFWRPQQPDDETWENKRPEYKRATLAIDARRVHSGGSAQQWFNNWATHTAGIYQRVTNLTLGQTLALQAWVQCFSSNGDDFSHSDGRYYMRIGIDPYGGTDPESADIVWSNGGNSIQPYDAYQLLQVETVAKSDRATVFIWGRAEWALKHNDAYVDDVQLYISGDPISPGTGLTEAQVRAIVRQELAAAVQAWADSLK